MSVDPLEGALSFLRVRELSWDQLVLPPATLGALQELTAGASAGGLAAVVTGPAGVGKTVAVRTCAEELRLDNVAARAELWRRLGWRAHPLIDVDVDRLALLPLAGAEIERLLDLALETIGDVPTTKDLLELAERSGRPPLP